MYSCVGSRLIGSAASSEALLLQALPLECKMLAGHVARETRTRSATRATARDRAAAYGQGRLSSTRLVLFFSDQQWPRRSWRPSVEPTRPRQVASVRLSCSKQEDLERRRASPA